MEDKRPDPLELLVRLGWALVALGALLPVSMIAQIVQDGGVYRFANWIYVEIVLGLLAVHAGQLLIRKSSSSLGWAVFSATNLLMTAAGFLHFYILCELSRRMKLSEWLHGFVDVPNIFLQVFQIPFLICLLIVLLRSRWHQGLLASWSTMKAAGCRTVAVAGLGLGLFLQILWRLIEQRMTFK